MKKKYTFLGIFIVVILLITTLFYVINKNLLPSTFNTNPYTNIEVAKEESCQQCHQNTTGYSNYHNPELIGCASCHLGNTSSLDKNEAHKGMVLIPGNLSDAKETCGKCHQEELNKLNS